MSIGNNALIVSTTTGASMTGASMIASINENAVIIGLSLSATGILIGLFFHIYTWLWRKRQEKIQMAEFREAVRAEILAEMKGES